jgi:hypothetical protein
MNEMTRTSPSRLAAALCGALLLQLVAPAQAASPAAPAAPAGMPTLDPAPAGTIPWQLLMQAKTVQLANKKFAPEFTAQIRELNNQQVKLYGFMMPLDQARAQKRFLLTAYPPHCAFCLPGGPEAIVEVIADKPVEFSYDPVVLAGKMEVLDSDLVYYRLTGAASVKY